MSDYTTTYSSGAILDCIPNIVKNHAISDLVIKTPGEINQRGGVHFTLSLDGFDLQYEILHTWDDLFQLTYSSPDEMHEGATVTEKLHRSAMISMFDDICGYMLDKTMFPGNYYEEE